MKYITKKFVTDMIDFMENNNVKVMQFVNCAIYCFSGENVDFKYYLHYSNPLVKYSEWACLNDRGMSYWMERRGKIIEATNKKQFLRNLSDSKMYGKPIYDSVKEIKSISKNRYKEVK